MSTPPDGEDRSEPTFADVMNAFSLDSGRKNKRKLFGRRNDPAHQQHKQPEEPVEPVRRPEPPPLDVVLPIQQSRGMDDRVVGPPGAPPQPPGETFAAFEDGPIGPPDASTFVRPYAWTRGRTSSGYQLEIETLVSTSNRGRNQMVLLQVEHRAVAELCQQARSVAEVAALLKVPLGVAKVLVGDMAGLGLVAVHQTATSRGNVPDLGLMERVLSGLRRL
jgi:hypothetical protein